MKYYNKRHFFLFDGVNDYIQTINELDSSEDYEGSLESVRKFFSALSSNFVEIVFKIVQQHVNELDLNVHSSNASININHIKNICNGIFNNSEIKDVLFNINAVLGEINLIDSFNIKYYGQIIDLIEELDLLCIIEVYQYLLNEDIESVLSFVLNKMNETVTYTNEESLEVVNDRFLLEVENKLRLFNSLYEDEEISLIMKNSDHLIYKINDVMKIIQLLK